MYHNQSVITICCIENRARNESKRISLQLHTHHHVFVGGAQFFLAIHMHQHWCLKGGILVEDRYGPPNYCHQSQTYATILMYAHC